MNSSLIYAPQCPYQSECLGCHDRHLSLQDQKINKFLNLKQEFTNLINNENINLSQVSQRKINEFHQTFLKETFFINHRFWSLNETRIRTRIDLIIHQGQLSLFAQNKKKVSISKCLQTVPELDEALKFLSDLKWPVQKGSLRLRILAYYNTQNESHNNENNTSNLKPRFGLWLDFANEDIKNLLIERQFLIQLSHRFIIQIGQKRKSLFITPEPEQLKLKDPDQTNSFEPWFTTWLLNPNHDLIKNSQILDFKKNDLTFVHSQQNNFEMNSMNLREKALIETLEPFPLKMTIGQFSQPSPLTARFLNYLILKYTIQSQIYLKKTFLNTVEFGSGAGQYTLSLLNLNHHVFVFESDELALKALKLNVEALNHENYFQMTNLHIDQGDFQNSKKEINLEDIDLVLVNPPKSGLKKFTQTLLSAKPSFIIYVSCFASTLVEDLKVLLQDYEIFDLNIVDQFPNTKHYESVVYLKRME